MIINSKRKKKILPIEICKIDVECFEYVSVVSSYEFKNMSGFSNYVCRVYSALQLMNLI